MPKRGGRLGVAGSSDPSAEASAPSRASALGDRAVNLDGLKGWIELAPVPGSCYVARHLVTDVLSDSMTEEDLALVVLLTSELVTNAIIHASGAVQLAVRHFQGCIRVEVSDDDGAHLPTVGRPSRGSESGRGMALVNALAEDWSVTARDRGKTVSFRYPAAR